MSWQIVPRRALAWFTSDDVEARDRTFAALLKMGRLDVDALERAFAGQA